MKRRDDVTIFGQQARPQIPNKSPPSVRQSNKQKPDPPLLVYQFIKSYRTATATTTTTT
ncbi:MAG: hypothetical protein K6253_01505 [Candidatus Liberibacter asiaticus]|nr:hypothetical protein [Candidatus Liberibacter asiaticus]